MKKILMTLLVVSALIVSLTSAALASEVYLDGLVNGDYKLELSHGDASIAGKTDFKSQALGLNLDGGRLLFNLDYAQESYGSSDSTDIDTLNLQLGCALSGAEQSYLALTAGYHQSQWDIAADTKFTGVIVGLKGVSNISEKSRLDASLGYSVSGSYKSTDLDTNIDSDIDADILLLQVKYSYYFTENLGMALGYKLTQYKFSEYDTDLGYNVDYKLTFSGPTIGLTYRF